MERTRYRDGIEVDQTDLKNTEDTKSSNILSTRVDLQHYGVVNGLEVQSPDGVTLTINPGRAYAVNGEIIEVNTAITNITGASVAPNVVTIVGLRITEVTTTPKAHETDPITEDTRFVPKPIAELFVATDATEEATSAATAAAVSAALNDANFVPLATVNGLGATVGNISGPVLPRSEGGQFPNLVSASAAQISKLRDIYNSTQNDEKPIQSAKDNFHRSLIGRGTPTARNPHGLTLDDLGFDSTEILQSARLGVSNGILGLEPSDDDFNPVNGSLAFATADAPSSSVTVQPILPTERVLINNTVFTTADVPNPIVIDFSALAAGEYYIVAQFGTDVPLSIVPLEKSVFDALCPTNNGTNVWLNNARDTTNNERQFFVIGLVNWNGGTAFEALGTGPSGGTLNLPDGGDVTYSTSFSATSPFLIPTDAKTLDLRRFGTVTNENLQKFTIRLDRLTEPVVTEANFQDVHQTVTNLVNPSGFDSTTKKHLTDLQANNIFGHKGSRGTNNHAVAIATVNDDSTAAGFVSGTDKWKLDNISTVNVMTYQILGRIDNISPNTEVAVGLARGKDDPNDNGGFPNRPPKACVVQKGFLRNFVMHLGQQGQFGNFAEMRVYVTDINAAANQLTPSFVQRITSTFAGAQNVFVTNTTTTVAVDASPSSPKGITVTFKHNNPDSNPRYFNPSLTFEYVLQVPTSGVGVAAPPFVF